MTLLRLSLILLASISLSGVQAQEKQEPAKKEPQFKLVEFHMVLLKLGPKWTSDITAEEAQRIHSEEMSYFENLVQSGKAVLGGPLTGDCDLKGVYVLRAKTAAEARTWVDNDPGVKAGYLAVEMHPWWSEEVMKPAVTPIKFQKAYLAFLVRGPKWTPAKTPETEEIQKAHLANINRLAEMKKLVVAGPFGDDGVLRGIFVFRVDTLAEAQTLAETDPAVQAGRLTLQIYPWLVPEGMLP